MRTKSRLSLKVERDRRGLDKETMLSPVNHSRLREALPFQQDLRAVVLYRRESDRLDDLQQHGQVKSLFKDGKPVPKSEA